MVLVLVPIAIILTAYVAYATSRQSSAWADALIRWVANWPVVGVAVAKVLGPLAKNGAEWIANRLGRTYLALENRAVNWLGAIGHYIRMVSDATIEWPIELLTVARWLVSTEIPRLVHALPNSVTRLIHSALAQVADLERAAGSLVAGLPKRVGKLVTAVVLGFLGPYLAAIRYFARVYHKIAHAASYAGGIAVPWIEVPRLRKDVRSLRKEFDRVKGILGVTAFAVVMARVLRVTPKCLTNGNIGRVARKLCGLGPQALEDLLGLIVDVVIFTDVCEVTRLLNSALSLIEPEITEFVSTVEGALCHGDFDAPPALNVAALSLPPVTGLTLSLA